MTQNKKQSRTATRTRKLDVPFIYSIEEVEYVVQQLDKAGIELTRKNVFAEMERRFLAADFIQDWANDDHRILDGRLMQNALLKFKSEELFPELVGIIEGKETATKFSGKTFIIARLVVQMKINHKDVEEAIQILIGLDEPISIEHIYSRIRSQKDNRGNFVNDDPDDTDKITINVSARAIEFAKEMCPDLYDETKPLS